MNKQPEQWTAPPDVPVPPRPHRRLPVGVKLILILTGFAIIRDLNSSINPVDPVLVFGTTVITGRIALLWYLGELAVLITLFVTILKRQQLGRILGIGVSAFKILLSSVNFFVYLADPEGVSDMLTRVVSTYNPFPGSPYPIVADTDLIQFDICYSALSSWIVGGAVIVYLVTRKAYFTKLSAARPSINQTQ